MNRSAGFQLDEGAQPTGDSEHRRATRSGSSRPSGPIPAWLRARSRAWWPVVVPLVVVVVGAWTYRWVDEDAFINFRIINNLMAGHGLVFNVGERVEVDSDPLWLFTLAALHGILSFVSLAWLSVFLGLWCTALGFVIGASAIRRLGVSRGETTILPVGLLIVSVVAGVWEFATSGLEMSMVFLWLGACFLLLVHVEARRQRAVVPAAIMGLGMLIRPELVLVSGVFVAALLVVVATPDWPGSMSRIRRYGGPVLAALAIPMAFQVFRMMYYALLIPNTGLAKAASSSWWSQGFTYLWNFVAPYTLWLPMLLAVPFVALPMVRWVKRGDGIGALVLATPIAAGLIDLLYVVYVGGDYMHARLVLPAFFAICLPIFATTTQMRTTLLVPLIGILGWAGVCAGWLRYVPGPGSLNPRVIFISNERNNWITATGDAHPITAADYRRALSGEAGAILRHTARQVPRGHQKILVVTNPYTPIDPSTAQPATSALPFGLAVNVPAIGVLGYLSGSKTYIFDEFSLANPIGSHTTVTVHARPGHEKYIGSAWMIARFGVAGDHVPPGGPSTGAVAAAAMALSCDPLRSYLQAITAPLTFSRAMSNFVDSFRFTTMSFSANPSVAARQLCGASRGATHPATPSRPVQRVATSDTRTIRPAS